MGLNNLEKTGFILFNQLYKYWYKFPVTWNDNFTELHLIKPLLPSAIPYITVALLNIGFSIAGCLIAFYYNKLDIFLKVETMDVLLLLMAAYATAAVFIMVPVSITCINGVNTVIQLEDSFLKGIRTRYNNRTPASIITN